MEPEGSLPCSQEPDTGHYPNLDESSPYPQNPVRVLLLAQPCYMPYLSHHPSLDDSNYIWRGVEFMKLLIMHFPRASYYFTSLMSEYSSQHPVLKHLQSTSFL
jgi:hypothetical protein